MPRRSFTELVAAFGPVTVGPHADFRVCVLAGSNVDQVGFEISVSVPKVGLHRDEGACTSVPGEPQGCQRVRSIDSSVCSAREVLRVPASSRETVFVHLLPRSCGSCRSGQPMRHDVRAAPPQPLRRGTFVAASKPRVRERRWVTGLWPARWKSSRVSDEETRRGIEAAGERSATKEDAMLATASVSRWSSVDDWWLFRQRSRQAVIRVAGGPSGPMRSPSHGEREPRGP